MNKSATLCSFFIENLYFFTIISIKRCPRLYKLLPSKSIKMILQQSKFKNKINKNRSITLLFFFKSLQLQLEAVFRHQANTVIIK